MIREYQSIEGLQLVRIPPGLTVSEAVAAYRRQPEVLYAEPDAAIYPVAVPNDTRFNEQWGLNNTGQTVNGLVGTADADIDAPEAWNTTTGISAACTAMNPCPVVVVIDTGVDYNHPDLLANVINNLESNCSDGIDNDNGVTPGNGYVDDCRGMDMVGFTSPGCSGNPLTCFGDNNPMDDETAQNSHGTRVAGIIGAVGNNSLGVTGVAWSVKLLPCKALISVQTNVVSDVIQCLDYVIATKNKHPELSFIATNNSWATVAPESDLQSLKTAIDTQRVNGILFIAAADNLGENNDTTPSNPASLYFPNIISVAATDQNDALATFTGGSSNFGRRTVHLGAPGKNILSTVCSASVAGTCPVIDPANPYRFGDGTSFSAPFVAGVAALLKAQTPSRDWRAIKNLVLAGGDSKAALASTTITGKRLNANGALTCTNQVLTQRMKPTLDSVTAALGSSITVAALNINCATPNGNVTVDVKNQAGQTIQTLTLLDDGMTPDQSAGDGIYSKTLIPSTAEPLTLNFPGGDVVTVLVIQKYKSSVTPFSYRIITGTNLNLDDDGGHPSSTFATPFPLLFGGFTFNSITVSNNGNVSFVGPPGSFVNTVIPDPSLQTLVAPLWDDLVPSEGSSNNVFHAVTGTTPNREFVVEWRNVKVFDCLPEADTVKLQIVFFENNSNILMNYSDVVVNNCSAGSNGKLATVGIQVAPDAATQFCAEDVLTCNIQNSTARLWEPEQNPAPVLNSISPTSAIAGDPGFTLTANGSNFVSGSKVRWNGNDRVTSFVSASQLTATISAADIASTGTATVTVFNPPAGGGTSAGKTFTISNPAAPVLNNISPTSATAGGAQFTLTANGSNFASTSKVRWNGVDRTTTFVNSGQLTATIPAADIATAGTATVTVFTPAPGGGTSSGQTFTINNPVPTTTNTSPTSATAGGAQFTLTVNGTNFVSGSKVRWNGSDRTTTFVNGTQLTATIPAADIAAGATVTVTVFNAAPGGGTSNGQTFTVNNPLPATTSLSPTNTLVGGAQFTLTVNGSNFVPTSVVRWNGADRATTFVNSGQVTATIPAADIAAAGTATVTVFNPTPMGGTSGGQTFTINNPLPATTNISPTNTIAGGAQFTLTVNGSNFVSGSVVRWNGSSRTTTFVNSGQLTATIPAADIATAGTATVTVFSPTPGGGTSGGQTFTVNNPVPATTSISPTNTLVGGPQFTLTVNGSNFVGTSVVRWNGVGRTTSFVSGSQLTATIPASDITAAGTATVTVFNPAPGGGTSNGQTFTINNPVPATTNISPTNTLAGGAQFTLTVNGANFVSTSKVRWNGSDRTTTFVNGGQLTATIPATDIATAGTATVTVFNPTPGGGTSNGQTFTINNPVPATTNILPTNTLAGGAQFTLTVNGSNFVGTSVVRWNGGDRTTTFVNGGQLTAAISAADISTAGTATVTVFNPTPGGGTSNGQTFTINNPLPATTNISPTNTLAGGAQFVLTVNGSNFVGTSLVRWNGTDRATTFISSGQLTATIPAADIATAGTATVTVFSPTPGGGTSNGQTFTINNPAPSVSSLSPPSTLAGGAQFTLTVNGSNFVSGSVVRWNGANRATTFVNSAQLTATILAADIATAGTSTVTVFSPAPGGGTSSGQTFTINNPAPLTSNISPTSATAGSAQFTLTVNGSNFVNGSVVRWNGSDRTTNFVNGGQLTATIPAADIVTGGTVQVTVFSPSPGGGTSTSQTFTINNPVPATTNISPTNTLVGGAGLTLTVNGSNFVSTSVVRWNGGDRATTFVNGGQLTATILASDIAAAGTATVTVFSPIPTGGTSNGQTFTINNPAPLANSISPSNTVAGGAQFTLTVNGSGFVSSSVVRWNGSNRATTFVNSSQLTATILAADIAAPASVAVTVLNPAPGGGTSGSQTFTVEAQPPIVLGSLSPSSAIVGGPQFTLTVNRQSGSIFIDGSSVVRWNGSDRATTFISGDQLTATILAADIAATGTAQVSVFTQTSLNSNSLTFSINNPLPALTNISPTNTAVGGAQFTLTVNGSSFVNGSVVRWNGSNRTTNFVGSGQLTATIPASDIAAAGTATVTVFNAAPGGGTSNGQTFTINNPAPALTSILPTMAAAGGSGFTLTVNGSGFVSSSMVRWNGSDRPTDFISGNQLTATIPASDITTAGTATVTVFNAGPGGGTSSGQTFNINNPAPALSSISPTSGAAGGPQFTLTANGSNFVSTSVVRWNGSDRVTTFVNSGQLTATIPAADIVTGGTPAVTVFNPAPSGGTSGIQTFTINNPLPTTTNISPTNTVMGGGQFTLTVNGSNFVSTSVVRWNGSDRATTFVNSGQLTATILSGDIAAAGTATVTVFNPAPIGGTSGGQTFTINNPTPATTSISPTSKVAGAPGFTLTVNGSNFLTSSKVRWNGTDRTTTFMNSTQLTASVAAADIAAAGTANVTVFTPGPGGGTSNVQTLTINPPPVVNNGGVVSAASFMAGAGLAPGSIAAVFGTNMAESLAFAPSVPLPTTLGGATMQFTAGNTFPVPKFFTLPSQINMQIPWELAGQASASLTDTVGGSTSAPVVVPLATFQPAIFAANAQGFGQGAILIANTPNLAAPVGAFPGSRPAVRGQDFLEIYCTGLGPVTNQPASGAAAGVPLSTTTTPPTVTVGGVNAPVLFSGLAPGFVGLYVVTLQVPANSAVGGGVSVVLTIGGVQANMVTIAVQ